MWGKDASNQILKVPLSNNTISMRIDNVAIDIKIYLLNSVMNKEFVL